MLIRTTLSGEQVRAIVANVAALYDGNVTTPHDVSISAVANRAGRYTHRMRLVPLDSSKRGARYAASGRRVKAASWEVHRDFLRDLFALDPSATVRTALAVYAGADDFAQKFPATRNHRVGSQCAPVAFGDLSIL